jgi:hypothetical protein
MRPDPHGRGRLVGVALSLLAALTVGCGNLRYFTSYEYRHVKTQEVKEPLPEREYASSIFRDGEGWFLRILEMKVCRRKTVEVAEETARIKVTAPNWFYFVGLGGLAAVMSTPFWVLGSRADSSKDRAGHFTVGTLVFLLPGLALIGLGTYYRLRAGTYTQALGQRERVRSETTGPCGVEPAASRRVSLGTRIGPRALGVTDAQGRVALPVTEVRPLVRWDKGKAEKVYFDVFVEDESAHEVRVPKDYPVGGADLVEPTRR